MIRIKLIFFFCVGILFGQTKWSKCKIDNTKLRECLDGEVKKKEWNKWYIAYECESENAKHYYWVADKIISDDAQPVKFLSTDTLTITLDGVSASIDLSTLANGD